MTSEGSTTEVRAPLSQEDEPNALPGVYCSPQPQRPTNQVRCDTERNRDDGDFKQALDRVHGRAIG